MLNHLSKISTAVLVCLLIISCSKDSGNGPEGEPGGVPGGATGGTPYIEYKIGTSPAVRVDCSQISFEARPNETVSGVMATSMSTKASFSFAFPAKTAELNKLSAGSYPIRAFNGTIHGMPFDLSLRAPKTIGGTDYFSSTEPTNAAFKNEVISLTKGDASNGKQVHWINGQFNFEAKNAAGDLQTISGSYRFKLITLD